MEYRTKIRLRMSAKDAHYGGNLVDGAHMVHLFGDVDSIDFLAPVYAGDFIEAEGWIDKEGNTSRHMQFEARKVAISRPDISASAADELDEPIVVCRASGTCVTPKDCQRKG